MEIHYNKESDGNHSVFVMDNNFLDKEEQEQYLVHLQNIEDWKSGEFFGNTVPRLQKWYHDDGNYFSKYWTNQDIARWKSHEAEEWLLKLRVKIQQKINEIFETMIDNKFIGCNKPSINSCLINYYRTGNDFINYHRDDERIFGDNPSVAMMAFGQERNLEFKRTFYNNETQEHKINKDEESLNKSFKIKAGSLFIMMGATQKYYCHGIERDRRINNSRYSVTFRDHR